jgi:hypothetical protein
MGVLFNLLFNPSCLILLQNYILPLIKYTTMLCMTKINWEKLQLKFWFEHSQTGISAKGWCNKYQLNYATARRYIKVRTLKESVTLQVESNPIVKARATPKRRGPPYGSQNAFKHGGYSK